MIVRGDLLHSLAQTDLKDERRGQPLGIGSAGAERLPARGRTVSM